MLTIGFFFLTFGIFFLFVILLTIFGYFIQYHLFKTFKSKKLSLTLFFESFGVGVVIYIFYSYFIIDFLKSFNFFFNFIPLVVFDIANIFYYFYKFKSEKSLKDFFINFKHRFLTKQNKRNISILFLIFILFLITQYVIETNLSLPAKDPYNWFMSIRYLWKHGDLDYDTYTVYGTGFVIYEAGALLIVQDYYILYFFIKYTPVFFFFMIILLIFDISSKIFKKDYEILTTLIILICFNSLLYRFSLCVPSLLATVLGIIFINTLFERDNWSILFIRGILLGGIFLVHLFYFILFFGFFLLFEFYYLIMNMTRKETKRSEVIKSFLRRHGLFLLIIFILMIPYVINIILSGETIIGHIERYLFRRYTMDSLVRSNLTRNPFMALIILSITPSTTDLLKNLIFIGFDIPINKTLSWGVIFIVVGLLYFKKWDSPQKKYLIEFIKFTFIFSFLIFILISFAFIINDKIVFSITSFIYDKGKRVFEIFTPCWSILFVLGVKKIIKFIKVKKIKKKISDKAQQIEFTNIKMKKTYIILLLILGGSLYSYHLYFHYNIIYENYYEDDDLTEAILFIGDYFEKRDLKNKNLLVPKLSHSYIYDLLHDKSIDIDKFDYDDTSYSRLIYTIISNESDYVLVDKEETKDSALEEIENKMTVRYENKDYLFFKVE